MSADIIVAGAGAAGMMAAAVAAENGAKVLLLEKNRQEGKKLLITGKGRCNLTNNCPVAEVIDNIPAGGRFLKSALYSFTPGDAMELFESLGVTLKTERGNRVFPYSDKAGDIVAALKRYMSKNGVIQEKARVTGVTVKDGEVAGVMTESGGKECKACILATGGMSYPETGSTGDGYEIARKLGHTVTELRGSLVPLEAEGNVCSRMQGLTLKNIRFTVFDSDDKVIYTDFGELLFTHFGISGPVVLSASAHITKMKPDGLYALVDLKPALDEKTLNARILRDFKKYINRDFQNALGELLPSLCIPVIIEKTGIPPDTKVHSITRVQRLRLVHLLKNFRINLAGLRPVGEAVITSGGVDLREINPKTMESKLVRGLYFAGEIIDADAYTGGFNLQIAWSTANAAARAAAKQAAG